MPNIAPVEIPSARDAVLKALREAILINDIKAGEVLNIRQTAEKLGVSTMPVREALILLQHDGLVKLQHHRGAVVTGITERYIREYYDMRALLESEAARLAAMSGKEKDVLEKYLGIPERKLFDEAAFATVNQNLHFAIWELSGNHRLEQMLNHLWVNRVLHSLAEQTESEWKARSREHDEIIRFILNGDSAKAAESMRLHILNSKERLVSVRGESARVE